MPGSATTIAKTAGHQARTDEKPPANAPLVPPPPNPRHPPTPGATATSPPPTQPLPTPLVLAWAVALTTFNRVKATDQQFAGDYLMVAPAVAVTPVAVAPTPAAVAPTPAAPAPAVAPAPAPAVAALLVVVAVFFAKPEDFRDPHIPHPSYSPRNLSPRKINKCVPQLAISSRRGNQDSSRTDWGLRFTCSYPQWRSRSATSLSSPTSVNAGSPGPVTARS